MNQNTQKASNNRTEGTEGKVGRRQLIQVLGAVAGSALVGAVTQATAAAHSVPAIKQAAPPARTGHARFQAVAYNHISYNVPDYAKDRDFWIRVLGMEDAWDDGVQCAVQCGNPPNQVYIRPVNPKLERRLGFQPPRGPWAAHMGRGFVDHYCFSIADYNGEAVRDELERRGLNPKPDGPVAWNFKDPSGWTMHISAEKGLWPGGANTKSQVAAGLKNLASYPKPSRSPFKAISVSHCLRMVPNVEECRDFYMDLLGMNLLYYRPGELPGVDSKGGPICFLTFGPNNDNGLIFRKSPNGLSYVDHFSMAVADYNQEEVKTKLVHLGYDPKPDSKYAWSIEDPEGMRTEVTSPSLLNHIAGDCNGYNSECPGGLSK